MGVMFKFFEFTLVEIILLLVAIILLFACITFTFDGLICFNCMIAGIYNWQTLLSGFLAIVAAKMTVNSLEKQYKEDK